MMNNRGLKNNILIVFHGRFDGFNRRLEREFIAFNKLNYNVYILSCIDEDNFQESKLPENVTIIPVSSALKRIPAREEWIWNPYWFIKIQHVVKKIQPIAIFVREMFHVPVAKFAAPSHIPVILDMAENVPALRLIAARRKFAFSKILLWHKRARRVEKIACRLADHIVVVVEEQKQRLVRIGLKEEKISIVGSLPIPEAMRPDDEWGSNALIPNPDSFPIISFVGAGGVHRGIDILLKAVPGVVRYFPKAQFMIVGDHLEKMPDLKRLINQLNIQDYVSLPGRVTYGQALRYMQYCDIGVIPHRNNEHINTTMPNKIFDYMFFGKPLVVSNARPLARIVQEAQCGCIYRDPYENDLSESIVKLAKDNNLEEIGQRGRMLVENKYNWKVAEKEFINMIENLI